VAFVFISIFPFIKGPAGSLYIGFTDKEHAESDALLWWNLFLGGSYDTSIRTFGE